MSKNYDDIINLPRPFSKTRTPMPIENRAAQFSPFAALSGHEAAIRETARLTRSRARLSESALAALDRKLSSLAARVADRPQIKVTYFRPDPAKAGGNYLEVSGLLKRVDSFERVLILQGGHRIPLEDILEIEG